MFFRIAPRPTAALSQPEAVKRSVTLGDLFRKDFNSVWQQIPKEDRQIMLDYWHNPKARGRLFCRHNAFPRVTLINVLDIGP